MCNSAYPGHRDSIPPQSQNCSKQPVTTAYWNQGATPTPTAPGCSLFLRAIFPSPCIAGTPFFGLGVFVTKNSCQSICPVAAVILTSPKLSGGHLSFINGMKRRWLKQGTTLFFFFFSRGTERWSRIVHQTSPSTTDQLLNLQLYGSWARLTGRSHGPLCLRT